LDLLQPISGTAKVTVPPGDQKRIPLMGDIPMDPASKHSLHAVVKFNNGETQRDSFSIDILSQPAAPQVSAKIGLFDPKGETAKLLDGMGLRWSQVNASDNVSAYDALIIGKGAVTLEGAAPNLAPVRDGLKVIVFEQTGEVLEKRFGFRIAEYGLRQVFRRVPDHPILAGLQDEHLRNWRGDSTTLPPRLKYELSPQFSNAPTVKWAGITVTRIWRNGNRGNVASALIEKPACRDVPSPQELVTFCSCRAYSSGGEGCWRAE
jgi:hypothetical protein